MNITSIVKNTYADLVLVSAENAYYNINVSTDAGMDTHRLIVPLNEIGTATLKAREKTITLMRWIRKAIENKELIVIKRLKFEDYGK